MPNGYVLVNRYKIDSVLGSGGFAITYLATDLQSRTQLVIKENFPFALAARETSTQAIYPIQSREDFKWATDNFINEAQTLSKMRHPNIVQILRAFKANNTAYYVMPYIKADSLDKILMSQANMDEELVKSILNKLLSALAYMHELNILHRDIKPANILLAGREDPILIDFGSARSNAQSKNQTILASNGFSPLEQVQGRGNVGPWTDLYALGASFYRMIDGNNVPDCFDRIGASDSYRALCNSHHSKNYSAALLSQIDKSLQMDIALRWSSAAEWQAALYANNITPPPSPMSAPNNPSSCTIYRIKISASSQQLHGHQKISIPVEQAKRKIAIPTPLSLGKAYVFHHFHHSQTAYISFHANESLGSNWSVGVQRLKQEVLPGGQSRNTAMGQEIQTFMRGDEMKAAISKRASNNAAQADSPSPLKVLADFSISGRMTRLEYWRRIFVMVIANVVLSLLLSITTLDVAIQITISAIVNLYVSILAATILVRRLHDINMSGAYVWTFYGLSTALYIWIIYLVSSMDDFVITFLTSGNTLAIENIMKSVASLGVLIILYSIFLFVCTFIRGTDGQNKYGAPQS